MAQYLGPAIFATVGPSCTSVCTAVSKHNNNRNWQIWFRSAWGQQCSQWVELLLPASFRALYSFFCESTFNLHLIPLDWQTLFFLAEVRHGEEVLLPPSLATRRLDDRVYPYAWILSFPVQDEFLRQSCIQLYDQESNCYNRNRAEFFRDELQLTWYVCQRGHIAKLHTLGCLPDSAPEVSSIYDMDLVSFGFYIEGEDGDQVDGFFSNVDLRCPSGNPQSFTLNVELNIKSTPDLPWLDQEDVEQYLADLCWAVV